MTQHYAATLICERIGDSVSADLLDQVRDQLSQQGLRVDVPFQLNLNSQAPGMPVAWEIPFSAPSPIVRYSLNSILFPLAQANSVSIGVRPSELPRGARRLVFFDMDSTLIRQETIDELGRQKGVYPEISKITEAAMRGEMDYDESLRRRVELLRGLPVSQLEKVFSRLEPTPGANELIESLRLKGHKTAVLSGGFSFAADRLKKKLGLDYAFSNSLEVSQQQLTGRVIPPFVNAAKKAALLEEVARKEGIPLEQTVAVGDGANDLLMLGRSGFGIAFNAKPIVSAKADFSLRFESLMPLEFLIRE